MSDHKEHGPQFDFDEEGVRLICEECHDEEVFGFCSACGKYEHWCPNCQDHGYFANDDGLCSECFKKRSNEWMTKIIDFAKHCEIEVDSLDDASLERLIQDSESFVEACRWLIVHKSNYKKLKKTLKRMQRKRIHCDACDFGDELPIEILRARVCHVMGEKYRGETLPRLALDFDPTLWDRDYPQDFVPPSDDELDRELRSFIKRRGV